MSTETLILLAKNRKLSNYSSVKIFLLLRISMDQNELALSVSGIGSSIFLD